MRKWFVWAAFALLLLLAAGLYKAKTDAAAKVTTPRIPVQDTTTFSSGATCASALATERRFPMP